MTERELQAQTMMQEIAKEVQAKLPEGMGFMLMVYEFGDAPDRRALYVSNSSRVDIMRAMVEILEKNLDDPEIWGITNTSRTYEIT